MDFDLFVFYRFLLATAVCVYGLVRLIQFVWRWQGFSQSSSTSALAYRYVTVLLLRTRLRRFAWDWLEIAGLLAVLALLIRSH